MKILPVFHCWFATLTAIFGHLEGFGSHKNTRYKKYVCINTYFLQRFQQITCNKNVIIILYIYPIPLSVFVCLQCMFLSLSFSLCLM